MAFEVNNIGTNYQPKYGSEALKKQYIKPTENDSVNIKHKTTAKKGDSVLGLFAAGLATVGGIVLAIKNRGKIADAVKTTADKFKDVYPKAKDKIKEGAGKLRDGIQEKGKKVIDYTKEKAPEVKTKASENAKKLWTGLKDAGGKIFKHKA